LPIQLAEKKIKFCPNISTITLTRDDAIPQAILKGNSVGDYYSMTKAINYAGQTSTTTRFIWFNDIKGASSTIIMHYHLYYAQCGYAKMSTHRGSVSDPVILRAPLQVCYIILQSLSSQKRRVS